MFDWKEFLEVARFLHSHSKSQIKSSFSEEAATRCVAGRAYYSAFRYALDYVDFKGWYTPLGIGKDHGNLIKVLHQHNEQANAATLHLLKGWRRQSDYKQFVPKKDLTSMRNGAISAAASVHQTLV
jgi:hypothetical protein